MYWILLKLSKTLILIRERETADRYLLISRTVLQALTVPKLSRSTEKLLDVYIVKQYQWIMLFDNGYAFVLNITNIFWP